jgi:hypothetical protein
MKAFVLLTLIRYGLCLAVALLITLLLSAVFGQASARPAHNVPRYKAWTIAYRTSWNEECADEISRSSEPRVSEKEAYNFCDCVSDLLQERWDEVAFEKIRRTPLVSKYLISANKTCLP